MPQLQQIAAARGSAELVGVGLPPYGQLAGYAGKHALAFPIAVDDQGEVSKRYRATLTPMLMVLAADGSVVYKHVGQLDTERDGTGRRQGNESGTPHQLKEMHMIGKKTLFSSVTGIVIVAAMSFGAAQAFATQAKAGFAPGCEFAPGCPYGGSGHWSGPRLCCDPL